MTAPDLITVSRLLLAGPFGYLLFAGYPRWVLLAVFGVAAATDWLDGFVARRLGQVSPRGAWLDQMVDRCFTVSVVALLLGHGAPSALLALSCTREITGLVGVAIALWRGVPLYHVEYVGKVTTAIQSVTLGAIILDVPWALYLAIACAVVGVVSGANYARYARSAPRLR
jgi:phosphatidylglycerophosphate synthase